MTPAEIQQAIEANTQSITALSDAVGVLVSQFIRPNAQQSVANQDQLEQLTGFVLGNAEAIAALSELFETNQQQIAANTAAISALTERLAAFDNKLEETRNLVAENAQQLAITGRKVDTMADRVDQVVDRIDQVVDRVDQVVARVDAFVEEGQAVREAMQTQLTAIISNARRIERIEQQAS